MNPDLQTVQPNVRFSEIFIEVLVSHAERTKLNEETER